MLYFLIIILRKIVATILALVVCDTEVNRLKLVSNVLQSLGGKPGKSLRCYRLETAKISEYLLEREMYKGLAAYFRIQQTPA